MNIINGFRLDGTDIGKLNNVLETARLRVREALAEEYHRLLSLEVTQLVDDIAMNYVGRPDVPILQAAGNMLDERIRYAGMGCPTEYNLEASLSILTDEKDFYLLLRVSNPLLHTAFAESSMELRPFGVSDTPGADTENDDEALQTWNSLRQRYGDNLALSSMTAILSAPVEIDKARLRFDPAIDRARDRARHTVLNRRLTMYACGKEIPPWRLMPLMDLALTSSLSEESESEMQALTSQLAAILPSITLELIESDPGMTRQETTEAT